ncbi:MAG: amidohydrolase [Candidatus Zixiibacteriota bacterium]
MPIDNNLLDELIEFRHFLHQNPELSRKEKNTFNHVIDFVGLRNPDRIIRKLGGFGFALVFEGDNVGPSVLLRTDIDALPIKEINRFDYHSRKPGISHMCGHDGHMAIMAGLARILSFGKLKRGRIILLFQPAEEVGEGARDVIEDSKFKEIEPDMVFALHNLPGFPEGSVISRYDTFAAASRGFIARLFGKTSHAGEPEKGISPAIAVADAIKMIDNLPGTLEDTLEDFILTTIIHARIGEIAFGTSPGYAEIMATLRSYTNKDMKELARATKEKTIEIAKKHNLKIETEWTEIFPATINDKDCVNNLLDSARELELDIIEPQKPFRWSEDFGYFTDHYPGVFFGIGSGIDHAKLHNPDYDFPDDIIVPSIMLFERIISKTNG